MGNFTMPSLGADMTSAYVTEWRVEPGDKVKSGDVIAVVETDKGDIEVEVWENGVVESIVVETGLEVDVDTVLAVIAPDTGVAEASKVEEETLHSTPPRIRATPLARRMASELGLDLTTITGTGPSGSICKADIEKASPQPEEPSSQVEPTLPLEPESPVKPVAVTLPEKAKKPKENPNMRKAVAEAMSLSNKEIPHYYLKTRVNLARALNWMEQENAGKPIEERLLAVNLFAKAIAKALRRTPQLNAYWLENEHQIQEPINLGLAVSLRSGGVLVPALLDCSESSLDQLKGSMKDLLIRARTNKLRASEVNTATITMTNLGERGVEEVYGVIFPPQVALVGIGKILEQPWAEDGMLGVRPVVTLTLAADHRATDGRVGARFLNEMSKALQNPETL